MNVTLAKPAAVAATTTALIGNQLDKVTSVDFPIGDTVTAEECDSAVTMPATISTNCDSGTQLSGTVQSNGKLAFSGFGVKDRSSYVESGNGTVSPGGTADIVVDDSDNAALSIVIPITLAP